MYLIFSTHKCFWKHIDTQINIHTNSHPRLSNVHLFAHSLRYSLTRALSTQSLNCALSDSVARAATYAVDHTSCERRAARCTTLLQSSGPRAVQSNSYYSPDVMNVADLHECVRKGKATNFPPMSPLLTKRNRSPILFHLAHIPTRFWR
jgi:hypothetical protein